MTSTIQEDRIDTRRRKPFVAGARLSPAEMNQLRELAHQRGESVSGLVRSLILDATESGTRRDVGGVI
jgi:hypothetical protein